MAGRSVPQWRTPEISGGRLESVGSSQPDLRYQLIMVSLRVGGHREPPPLGSVHE
jgi:hypothetical protein